MTHYKWYDYKHAHTTYRKQLTNNTKQTDKTKKRKKEKKKKEKKRNKHEQKEKKRKQNKNKNQHPPPPQKKEEKKEEKKQQCIHDVDDIQVTHTNLSTAASGIHLRIKRTIGEGRGGGILTPSSCS